MGKKAFGRLMRTYFALKEAPKGGPAFSAHEEEYIRGPGMLFAGDPGSYLTIIRYPVRKRAAP